MPKYKKKPIIVEAMICAELLSRAKDNWGLLPGWIRDAYELGNVLFHDDHILIKTLGGDVRAEFDDMVVCGEGKIYPCGSAAFVEEYDIFNETQDVVEG